jgi:cytohesin
MAGMPSEIEDYVVSFSDCDDLRVWELCDSERRNTSKRAWESLVRKQVLRYPWLERLSTKDAVRLCRFLTSVEGSRTLPIHVAARNGYCEIISLMIATGTDMEEVDASGLTCLMVAAAGGRGEAVDKLLDAGASISAKTSYGLTALHLAASHLQAGVAAKLLQSGAPPNAQDKEGRTPLHFAMLADQRHQDFTTDVGYQTVAVLVRGGANTGLEDIRGKTPWHMWNAAGRGDVCDLLHEAQPDMKSRSASWPTYKDAGAWGIVQDTKSAQGKALGGSGGARASFVERIVPSCFPLASLAAMTLKLAYNTEFH